MISVTKDYFLVLCLVLALISKAQGGAEQSTITDKVEEDSYDYSDYDYTEYNNENDNDKNQDYKNNSKTLTTLISTVGSESPYFEKKFLYISADQNDNVTLNCDVKNFNANKVVIWYKEQTVYSHGQHTANPRIENLKNNSIVLKNVQPDDSGNYYCEIFPDKVRLQLVLEVKVKMFSILCDDRNVIDRTIVFRQGESHVCECKPSGSNTANIKWFINGNRIDESIAELKDGSIIINSVDDYHSGVYQCLDDDGGERPTHGMFNIEVLFPPKVTTHRHHINTELKGNAELYCDYKGNPIAVATWIKNNQPIKYSEKYMITYTMERHFNRSTLTVKDINNNDLGEYICKAENSLGLNELRTHLMLEPEKGQLENVTIDGKRVTLVWLVRSLQPLSEAVLDYKMFGSYTWSSTKVIHTQRNENGIWKVTHEIDLIEGEWQTRMRTKNTFGWSKFSPPFVFKLEDKEDNFTLETSDENVAMAGFGLKTGSSAIACDSYFLSLILALSIQIYMM